MQTELSSRMEKIWSMSSMALKQGHVDYGVEGHCKVVNFSGISFHYNDGNLVRVSAPRLDITIARHLYKSLSNIVLFPATETTVHFMRGNDEILNDYYRSLSRMHEVLSPKRVA